MNRPRAIELLSPAKDAAIGREAILHGADAVYIGAPRFGARAAAGCSVDDISRLCDFAHQYKARVYVALNTILYDKELAEAEQIVWQLYRAQVDALIVQDMSLLQLDLPPIALHASTQCDNRTPDKVKFLAQAGFSQVVLARELSLEEIRSIASATDVTLEAFVHGALCVSYSGQCYLSAAIAGRSANRGECAQCCRLPYTLTDATGKILARDRHLLSLKDLNLSDSIEDLLDAGISSLKIEGRLKEAAYVKNVTTYYRKKLDAILERRSDDYRRSSEGTTEISFTPDPRKSFNRGFTSYFFNRQPEEPIIQPATPKSLGEPIGKITSIIDTRTFCYDGTVPLHNGDGLCYIDNNGNFNGFRLNRAEGKRLHAATPQKLTRGIQLFRNSDTSFEAELARPTARRTIAVTLRFYEISTGFAIDISDGNIVITHRCDTTKTPARTPQRERIKVELSKLGNTPFIAQNVTIDTSCDYFIPVSQLSEWRREAITWFQTARRLSYRPTKRRILQNDIHVLSSTLDYHANVANAIARNFYLEHGAKQIELAFEIAQVEDAELMRTRHCIRRYMGACLRTPQGSHLQAPLYISNGNTRLMLQFDCARCEMVIKRPPKK